MVSSASKIYRRLEHKSDLYKMDIRSYFGSTSQASSDAKADSDSEDHGIDSSDPESSPSPPPSKKVCKSSKNKRYHRSVSTKRKYSKSWEKDFSWLYYDEDSEGAFCKICKQSGISGLQRTGGVWVTKHFKNWKKAVEKMKAHSRSDFHSQQPKLCWQLKELWWTEQLYSNSRMLKLTKGLRTELQ